LGKTPKNDALNETATARSAAKPVEHRRKRDDAKARAQTSVAVREPRDHEVASAKSAARADEIFDLVGHSKAPFLRLGSRNSERR
jgi:hypothetical protein